MKVQKAIQRQNETKNRKNKIYLAHFSGVLENGHGYLSLLFRAKRVKRREKKSYRKTVRDQKKIQFMGKSEYLGYPFFLLSK